MYLGEDTGSTELDGGARGATHAYSPAHGSEPPYRSIVV